MSRAPDLIDAIEAAPIPTRWCGPNGRRDAFLRIVRTGGPGAAALDVLDRIGRLERFLPAWREVRCRPQRDPYHRYTVDAHLTGALRACRRACSRDPTRDPLAAELAPAIVDRDAVFARRAPARHRQDRPRRSCADRRGDRSPAAGRDGAAARDRRARGVHGRRASPAARHGDAAGSDRREPRHGRCRHGRHRGTAGRAVRPRGRRRGGDRPRRLDPVAADARAGAGGQGSQRVRARRDGRGARGAPGGCERRRSRARLASEPEADVDRFVLRMPRGYFLSMEPAQAARHFHAIAPTLGANEVRTISAPGGPDAYELLVVTPDRPALLALVAGALAVGGISILSAQVFTTDDHVAADVFEVAGVFEPEITEERWRAVPDDASPGRSRGRSRSTARWRRPAGTIPPRRCTTPVTVRVDNEASDFSTVIEVGAPDRMGLLYDITGAFAGARPRRPSREGGDLRRPGGRRLLRSRRTGAQGHRRGAVGRHRPSVARSAGVVPGTRSRSLGPKGLPDLGKVPPGAHPTPVTQDRTLEQCVRVMNGCIEERGTS